MTGNRQQRKEKHEIFLHSFVNVRDLEMFRISLREIFLWKTVVLEMFRIFPRSLQIMKLVCHTVRAVESDSRLCNSASA